VRVGFLWREEWDPPARGTRLADSSKLHGVFAAFADLGVAAEPVVYSDRAVDAVRDQLGELDAVLVWVNPLEQGLDRSRLDPMLREVADGGVFVSAHPDVILKMGTKKVLWDTRELSWGSDVRLYRSVGELRSELHRRLVTVGPVVLKQLRGMGGNGVWKVEPAADGDVIVQHASGDGEPATLPLAQFVERCATYFDDGGLLVEQPYQPRLADGMIRAYLTHDRVVGFTHQYPRGLMPPGPDNRPSGKSFEPADDHRFAALRTRLETEWVPELQRILELDTYALPVIWDADFLFAADDDAHVLCEINVSSTFAFPEFAMPGVARATIERITH